MRFSIRDQLALLVLLCSLTALMVLALAVWFQNYHFVINIGSSSLALIASLKAAQVSATLFFYQSQIEAIATRSLIQSALQRFNSGNQTNQNWNRTLSDIQGSLTNGNLLVQAVVFPSFNTTNSTTLSGLLNVTATLDSEVRLPFNYPNGSYVRLGDPGLGYPPMLYPSLTYYANTSDSTQTQSVVYNGQQLSAGGMLILGPLVVNDTYALFSGTIAVVNDSSYSNILGWLTVVITADLLIDIVRSSEGLEKTGEVLLVGPSTSDNRYATSPSATSPDILGQYLSKFVLMPNNTARRHKSRDKLADYGLPFNTSAYPAVMSAWSQDNTEVNNKGSYISTHNENNIRVSAGYARIGVPYVDWALIVELSYAEVIAPVRHLRNVVLICVFSVTGLLLLIIFPLAHYSIRPIRELRNATLKTIGPCQSEDEFNDLPGSCHEQDSVVDPHEPDKERFFLFSPFRRSPVDRKNLRRRTFRIPSKVPERKHLFTDELTELTATFNDMSSELTMRYEKLEQRVKERTAQLEASKKTAEVANQSKTLFIANISHELKTPLNGILGLTTVCMNEDDPRRVRSTLHTIYKLGDLLLHLLTDLLTFSKNEIGSSVSIEEAEFCLSDLSTQLIPTFEKQAREAQIDFKMLYLGTNDAFGNVNELASDNLYGPSGTGIVRGMCLSGDKNRILQVLMNFVSNGLKFTPAHGSVIVRVRCIGLFEDNHLPTRLPTGTRQSPTTSRRSKASSGRRARIADSAISQILRRVDTSEKDRGKTALSSHDLVEDATNTNTNTNHNRLSINLAGGTTEIAKIAERRRSQSPQPAQLNAKDLTFDFEVEDTGPGIPEDQQKRIFEPFVQGDLGLSKKYGGTGLGLSICAQLASLMGGCISLDSTVGRGSKFTMRIPLPFVSNRAAAATATAPSPLPSPSPSPASSIRHSPSAATTTGRRSHSNSSMRRDVVNGTTTGTGTGTEPRLTDVTRIVGFIQPYVANDTQHQHQHQNPKSDCPKSKAKSNSNVTEMQKQAEKNAVRRGKKVRVLVADDNPVNQEVVLRMLNLEHIYDVTIAKDGQEALDKVQESMSTGGQGEGQGPNMFDLVFMDVQMPNLDGIQSARLIRKAGFKSPIVALTAFAEKSNEDECMASGMDYFLAKPIRRPALRHVLNIYSPSPIQEEDEPQNEPYNKQGQGQDQDQDQDQEHAKEKEEEEEQEEQLRQLRLSRSNRTC